VAEFIALADLLRPAPQPPATIEEMTVIPDTPPPDAETVRALVRDARLFRARLADAFDVALARLLHECAVAVLARELALAPADLAAIVQRVRDDVPIVRVRCAEVDADALRRAFGDAGIVVDSALHCGDLEFELAGGVLDARLGMRLGCVLEAVR
jgi:hypothetical protein